MNVLHTHTHNDSFSIDIPDIRNQFNNKPDRIHTKYDLIQALHYYCQQFKQLADSNGRTSSDTSIADPPSIQQIQLIISTASHATTKFMLLMPSNDENNTGVLIDSSMDMFVAYDQLIVFFHNLYQHAGTHLTNHINNTITQFYNDYMKLIYMYEHNHVVVSQCHLVLERINSITQLPLTNSVCISRIIAINLKFMNDCITELNEMIQSSNNTIDDDDDDEEDSCETSFDFTDTVDESIIPAIQPIHTISTTINTIIRIIYLFIIKTKFDIYNKQCNEFLDNLGTDIQQLVSYNDTLISQLDSVDHIELLQQPITQLVQQCVVVLNNVCNHQEFQSQYTTLNDSTSDDISSTDNNAIQQCTICNNTQMLSLSLSDQLLQWYNASINTLHTAHKNIFK